MKLLYKIIFVFIVSYTSILSDGIFNHSKFDNLLSKFVNSEGMISYKNFVNNKEFELYLTELKEANIKGFNKNELLAFYLNAYNASVIKNVINHYPIKSPMEVDGFFKKKKFVIAGEELTLDELEYKKAALIEPVLMHFGLVCAAISCPKLITKVYKAETVREQLLENAKDFIGDNNKNRIDDKNKTLFLSEIFRWFKSTFEKKYGSLNKAVATLFGIEKIEKFDNYKIVFIKYNWDLNKQ